jgi:hypothetical protein
LISKNMPISLKRYSMIGNDLLVRGFLCGVLFCASIELGHTEDLPAPEANIQVERGASKQAIRFHISLSRPVPDCDFGLWGYIRPGLALEIPGNGVQTATFNNIRTEIDLAAVGLRPLRNDLDLKNRHVYFRLLLACEDGHVYPSPLVRYTVPQQAQSGVRSKRNWIFQVKREINYAELVDGE